MPKLVVDNPTPETGFEAVVAPVQPALEHLHLMRQIGVEHHWLPEFGAYEALPVMECDDSACSYQEGRKADFDQDTREWVVTERCEWDDDVHTEDVVIDRDEEGRHLR